PRLRAPPSSPTRRPSDLIRAVRPADGILLRDYFAGAGGATPAGEALFGAKDGLTIVRPGAPPVRRPAPAIMITDLRVGGVAVPADRKSTRLNSSHQITSY